MAIDRRSALPRLALPFLLLLLLGAAGCITTDPSEPFARVAGEVEGRTGNRVEWQKTDEDRQAAARRVDAMLADGLTLTEAVSISLANNRRLQAVYQDLGLAQAGLSQSVLLNNPRLSLKYKDNPDGGYILELEVLENFLSLFLIPLRKDLAQAELERAEATVTARVMDQVLLVEGAYYSLLARQEKFRVLKDLLLASEAGHEMAQRQWEAGNITRLDLLTRRSMVDADRLALSAASLEVDTAREDLNRLLGLWGARVDWKVEGGLPDPPGEAPDLNFLERRVVEKSLDLALAKAELRVAGAQLGVTNINSFLDEFTAGVALERETDGTWLRGPALEIPIPIFDPGIARREAARSELARRWEEMTALAVEVRSRARSLARALASARERAVYYDEALLPLRREITRQAQLRYNGMFMSVHDLLAVKRLELDARMGRNGAVLDYWLAKGRLDSALAGRMPQEAMPAGPAPAPMTAAQGGH